MDGGQKVFRMEEEQARREKEVLTAKSSFVRKILGFFFTRGAKALGKRVLTTLGLGLKATGAVASAGTTLLLEGGVRLARGTINFITAGFPSFVGGLLGVGKEEKGKGVIARFGEDLPLAGALVGVAVVFGVFLLSLLSVAQMGSTFVSWPHGLPQKGRLGAFPSPPGAFQPTATPSATPPPTPAP